MNMDVLKMGIVRYMDADPAPDPDYDDNDDSSDSEKRQPSHTKTDAKDGSTVMRALPLHVGAVS